MSETPQLPVSEMKTPDHGDFISVYGRDTVTQYERSLSETGSPEKDPSFREGIDDAREVMTAFTSDEHLNETVNTYFESMEDMPDSVRQAKAISEKEAGRTFSWTGWLAEKADDHQVLNFLQWHTFRHEAILSSPEHAAEIQKQKEEYKSGIKVLKASGILHEETPEDRVDDIQIEIKDIFHSHMFGVGHQSDPGTGDIAMVEGYKKVEFWHEMNHSVVGRLAENGFDKKQWLNEAVTEHIARVMKDGLPSAVNPNSRTGTDKGEYETERKMLAAILDGGTEPIPVKLLTRLYSAQTEPAKQEAEKRLKQASLKAYGVEDIFDRATEYIGKFADYSSGIYEEMYSSDAEEAVKKLISDPRKTLQTEN
jgi:hypothetical protein